MSLTRREIRTTARATLNALTRRGFTACLFGSAACAMYGMRHRKPNDIDVLVLTDADPEYIKILLVFDNKNFHLYSSENPENTYHVVWFSIRHQFSCKVDILIPGQLNIPFIPSRRIFFGERPYRDEGDPDYSYPIVPLLALILLKLGGWIGRQHDYRQHVREKSWTDKSDIDEMLKLAVENYGTWLGRRRERWMPEWFVEEGKKRVELYATAFPESLWYWRQLGFFRHLGGHIRLSEIEIVEDWEEADHVEIVVISDPE